MVDRKARDKAVTVLREFIQGSITNNEYERRFPKSRHDPALWAVYSQMWFHYSDLSEHTLAGKHTLSAAQLAHFERCILFLESELEFEWPTPTYRLKYGIIRLFGFGWLLKRQEKKEMSVGDIEMWPFLRKTDYEKALSRQRTSEDT